MFYTVHFTTKKQVTVYDLKRQPIKVIDTETPVVMHGMPHSTAMQYAKCDNFKMVLEAIDRTETRKPRRQNYERRTEPSAASWPKAKRTANTNTTSVTDAAATGDMAAAINGGK